MNAFSAAGLIYDIAGVILLALSLVATKDETLFQQSQLFWGGNRSLYKALMIQRLDAMWGLPLLIAGFLMQLEPAFFPERRGSRWWLLALICLLAAYLAIYAVRRSQHSKNVEQRFDECMKHKSAAG